MVQSDDERTLLTSATTSVIGDHAVTMTVAFLPLALIGLSVSNFTLLWVNLCFVAAMPAVYALFIHWRRQEHGFQLWQVVALDSVYVAYVLVVWPGVLRSS